MSSTEILIRLIETHEMKYCCLNNDSCSWELDDFRGEELPLQTEIIENCLGIPFVSPNIVALSEEV